MKRLYIRGYCFLIENNILANEQFGFREKSTMDMATYELLSNIQLSLDKKRLVGGMFCDLQKAFDCVNHDILLEKIKYYGITATAYKIIVLARQQIPENSD